MTNNDETISVYAINTVRDLQRKFANECFEKGVSPEDIALGLLYGTFDVAEAVRGPRMVALEWLRTGLDLMEDHLLAE